MDGETTVTSVSSGVRCLQLVATSVAMVSNSEQRDACLSLNITARCMTLLSSWWRQSYTWEPSGNNCDTKGDMRMADQSETRHKVGTGHNGLLGRLVCFSGQKHCNVSQHDQDLWTVVFHGERPECSSCGSEEFLPLEA